MFAGNEGFWKYEVDAPGELDDKPIGAGKLYLESEENCLRLHTAMGDVVIDEVCRTIRRLRDSARIETSMMWTVKSSSKECRNEPAQRQSPSC